MFCSKPKQPLTKTIDFKGQPILTATISTPTASASFLPECGARLMRLIVDNVEVIVWPENSDLRDPAKIRGGNPVLFPAVARHMLNGVVGQVKYETEGPLKDKVYPV